MAKPTKTINIDAGIHEEVKMLAQLDGTHLTVLVEGQLRKLLRRRAEDLKRMRRALGRPAEG